MSSSAGLLRPQELDNLLLVCCRRGCDRNAYGDVIAMYDVMFFQRYILRVRGKRCGLGYAIYSICFSTKAEHGRN